VFASFIPLPNIITSSRSLCGLPFKKLDKKSEKQFLFARRQQLIKLLEEAPSTDASTILDLTVLLLFQQVKNVTAFGLSSNQRSLLLKLLTMERKVTEEVAQVLTNLLTKMETNDDNVGDVDTGLWRVPVLVD